MARYLTGIHRDSFIIYARQIRHLYLHWAKRCRQHLWRWRLTRNTPIMDLLFVHYFILRRRVYQGLCHGIWFRNQTFALCCKYQANRNRNWPNFSPTKSNLTANGQQANYRDYSRYTHFNFFHSTNCECYKNEKSG